MNPPQDQAGAESIDRVRGRRVAAILLLFVAGAALAEPYLPFDWRFCTPLLLGLGFLLWSALARKRGLLVPGGVLVGVGVGAMLRPVYGEGAFLLALAGGFLLIAILSRVLFARGCGWTWPLFPAGGLLVAGLARIAGSDLQLWLEDALPYWPYLMIVLALYLLLVRPAPAHPIDKP